jgi:uncharacterized protein
VATLRVTVTGATGLIGPALVRALLDRAAHVTVLARDPARAATRLGVNPHVAGGSPRRGVEIVAWEMLGEPAPATALDGRDAVVHLAGASVAQRWSARAKRAIRDSRVLGTRNLVAGLQRAEPRPRALLSASAVGYYGAHGEEPLDEEAPPGSGFLAAVCAAWEAEAERADALGLRVVRLRTGIVLHRSGGALASMLTPFRAGVGGPLAGGRQYMSWIHLDDELAMMLAAIGDERWRGAINATAPEPASNRSFTRALGKALGRPALLPVPGLALRARYGEMAEMLTTGARVVPAKALMLGFEFGHPHLDEALRSALERS